MINFFEQAPANVILNNNLSNNDLSNSQIPNAFSDLISLLSL